MGPELERLERRWVYAEGPTTVVIAPLGMLPRKVTVPAGVRFVIMPEDNLDRITKNRYRWIVYAYALERAGRWRPPR